MRKPRRNIPGTTGLSRRLEHHAALEALEPRTLLTATLVQSLAEAAASHGFVLAGAANPAGATAAAVISTNRVQPAGTAAAAGVSKPAAPPAQPSPTKIAVPGVSGAWYTGPTTDSSGFVRYTVSSPYEKATTIIRVLLPKTYSAATTYKVIYVLPVEAGLGTFYGDGLATVKSANLQNSTNTIFVEPTFSDIPWYVNNPKNMQIWQETYFCSVVVPIIEQQYSVVAGPDGRLLLGFSKSGYGAFLLLLRHPDMFGRAFAWDSPLAMTNPATGPGMSPVVGTTQNFQANYQVSTLLRKDAALLKTQPARLFMSGYTYFQSNLQSTDKLMTSLGIPHSYAPGTFRNHVWQSGWLAGGVKMLLS
jgi:S-formylglutathione hydrolase FrmB